MFRDKLKAIGREIIEQSMKQMSTAQINAADQAVMRVRQDYHDDPDRRREMYERIFSKLQDEQLSHVRRIGDPVMQEVLDEAKRERGCW